METKVKLHITFWATLELPDGDEAEWKVFHREYSLQEHEWESRRDNLIKIYREAFQHGKLTAYRDDDRGGYIHEEEV